jgi:peptidoglycan-associated lipoprotein
MIHQMQVFPTLRMLVVVTGLFIIANHLSGCAPIAGQDDPNAPGTAEQGSPSEPVVTRSPSALEALSRGLAAVTPPGAPLKDIFYDFDSPDLREDARATLKANAEWMRAHPSARVEIEGHCDELGTNEYNLALGAKRAQVAKEYLVSLGIDTDRLVTISYGKEAPACLEHTEECRVKNRRARFVHFTELPTS